MFGELSPDFPFCYREIVCFYHKLNASLFYRFFSSAENAFSINATHIRQNDFHWLEIIVIFFPYSQRYCWNFNSVETILSQHDFLTSKLRLFEKNYQFIHSIDTTNAHKSSSIDLNSLPKMIYKTEFCEHFLRSHTLHKILIIFQIARKKSKINN